jgi:hypothetical protein
MRACLERMEKKRSEDMDKKPMNQGPRLIIECGDTDLKERTIEQAKARGFDSYKSYLTALIERDRDILAGIVKMPTKYIPKPDKEASRK